MARTKHLRFECQGCGQCCHTRGEAGFVVLTAEDQRRLAAHFRMPLAAFLEAFTATLGEQVQLKEEPGRTACLLMEGTRCGVYQARPLQCRTWPFWPEHLEPGAFEREVASFCPGAGKGEAWDPETVEIIADVQRRADRREE
ncbi:MAG: YkgJ family cysteine cluster protein [Myxococcales bacterium]